MLVPPTAAATVAISYLFSGGMSESRKPGRGQLQITHKAIHTFHSLGDREARQNVENGNAGT